MSPPLKKILKFGMISLAIWALLFFANEIFIRDLRIEFYEYRVKKSMQENFQENTHEFIELQTLLKKIKPNISTILEFKDPDTLYCFISSPVVNDYETHNKISYYFSSSEMNDNSINFQLQNNGLVIISTPDTTFKTLNWSLSFNGNKEDKVFKDLINYIGIKEEQLDSIRTLVSKLDCKDLSITNHSVYTLRYHGITLYKYEYLFTDSLSKTYTDYQKLSDGIYFGLFDSGMYCGIPIFEK